MTGRSRTYSGWQHEKVAFLFGLSGPRVTSLGAAALLSITPVVENDWSVGAATIPIAILLVLAAFARMAGLTADEWALTAVKFAHHAARSRTKFASGAFAPRNEEGRVLTDLPGIAAPLRFLDAPSGTGGSIAVVHHPYDRTYTAVARVSFQGILLADSERRNRRVAGWGALIDSLCTEGNPIIRIQCLQRVVPETGASLVHWHHDHLSPAAPDLARQVTTTLTEQAAPTAARREDYLAFTLDAARAAAAIRAAGGGDTGASAVLVRQCRALAGALANASLEIDEWLSTRELAAVVRTAYDPEEAPAIESRAARARALGYDGTPAGIDPALAGPAAAHNQWSTYRHDGAFSAAFHIGDWPMTQVYANFLLPMLGETATHRRSLSLHIEPLPPRTAQRLIGRERTARNVQTRLRVRTGQIIPEHEREAELRAHQQDAERAAGHGVARLTGYLVVTVTDPEDLEAAVAAVRADADTARIELRRMYGVQDVGFVLGALPFGMGLPRKGRG